MRRVIPAAKLFCFPSDAVYATKWAVLLDAVLLIVGLALVVKGGDLFVSAAVWLADAARVPRVVIGATLVSLATTAPELVVSAMAGFKGVSDLAVGNAVGSCICNIGLIFGLTAALKHVDVHPPALRVPLLAMFGFAVLLFLMVLDMELAQWQGIVLIACGAGYFGYDFIRHARFFRPEEEAEAAELATSAVARGPAFRGFAGRAVEFVLGAALVVVGSHLLVEAAVEIAVALGVPRMIIGLTVVAVGTSLPELVTAVTSSRKGVSDVAVGNVLGANIANLTLIVGTAAALTQVRLSRVTELFNFPVLLAVFGLMLWMLLTDRRVTRREGAVLLATYGLYLTGLVIVTLAEH
ncbi:MAG: calcium/sodium antiporter [Verrucomicrobiae bacterium]|nr:calcium/sodium antiporter [Verrucomicrobiae bacterium]MDW7979639.1 calcium/sodium antiporter [Verrucomicrobiales bacterium]